MNNRVKILLSFVFILLGFMIAVQYKMVNQSVGTISETRARELASQLKLVKEERDKLLEAKVLYDAQIRDYESAEAQGSGHAQLVKDELEKARMTAGLENVKGQGIEMVLDDLKFTEKYNYNLITYSMLLELVNEFNAAGAEAISINGQRIIATTEIREAGTHINVNTVKLAPPFTIKVIGDSKTLEAAVRLRGGIIEKIEAGGVMISITQSDKIIINKYNGIINNKYSQAVVEDVKK